MSHDSSSFSSCCPDTIPTVLAQPTEFNERLGSILSAVWNRRWISRNVPAMREVFPSDLESQTWKKYHSSSIRTTMKRPIVIVIVMNETTMNHTNHSIPQLLFESLALVTVHIQIDNDQKRKSTQMADHVLQTLPIDAPLFFVATNHVTSEWLLHYLSQHHRNSTTNRSDKQPQQPPPPPQPPQSILGIIFIQDGPLDDTLLRTKLATTTTTTTTTTTSTTTTTTTTTPILVLQVLPRKDISRKVRTLFLYHPQVIFATVATRQLSLPDLNFWITRTIVKYISAIVQLQDQFSKDNKINGNSSISLEFWNSKNDNSRQPPPGSIKLMARL